MIRRICLWAVPRSASTALMYAFRQRSDTRVVDEPLYGHYLKETNAQHPLNKAEFEQLATQGQQIMQELARRKTDRPVLFVKNMCHHSIGLELEFLSHFTNIFLTRNPKESIISLDKIIGPPELRDTAFDKQLMLFEHLRSAGENPVVIDHLRLMEDPKRILEKLCDRLELQFDEAMLQWPAGPKPEDNAGQGAWYHSLHQSTGFQILKNKNQPFPANFQTLLDSCMPLYQKIAAYTL